MGLFINKSLHPDVFKNREKIEEPNQKNSKIDPFSEWMEEQKRTYDIMNENLFALDKSIEQTKRRQTNQWRSVGDKLQELTERNIRQVDFEDTVLESLKKLEEKNTRLQGMVTKERTVNKELIEQINKISTINTEIVSQLEKSESVSETLSVKMDEQIGRQKTLSNQYAKQEAVQSDVLQRLETQEGLTEKMLRQLDHLRSVLFERTSFLADKIEQIYKLATFKKTKPKLESEPSTKVYKLIGKQEDEKSAN